MQGLLFFAPVVAKVGECYPVDTFIAFFNTWYKRSMITPEAWTPVIINSQCSSIKWIERSTEYVLPRIQVFIYIYIYIYIYDFHIFTTSVFCPLDSGVIQILDKRGSGKLCQFWAQAVSIETFLTLRTHDHRKYPKTVTGHVIWI